MSLPKIAIVNEHEVVPTPSSQDVPAIIEQLERGAEQLEQLIRRGSQLEEHAVRDPEQRWQLGEALSLAEDSVGEVKDFVREKDSERSWLGQIRKALRPGTKVSPLSTRQ